MGARSFEGEGGGVVVDSVELASPTALVVTVHTEPSARAGRRTVRVGEQTFAGFAVSSELSLEYLGDRPTAGGVARAIVRGRNPANPFVPAAAALLEPAFYRDGAVLPRGEGLSVQTLDPSSGVLIATLLSDLSTAVGVHDFAFVESSGGRALFTGSQLVDVAAAPAATTGTDSITVSFPAAERVCGRACCSFRPRDPVASSAPCSGRPGTTSPRPCSTLAHSGGSEISRRA